jgi:tetratricopeptide (TPR) repeat protein
LRKVEQRAVALGEAIDNSQLSRFEKGKAVPSFEKLRALARVFNVPVQNFSDVLDLEEFQAVKPQSDNYAELLKQGSDLLVRGEAGPAYVTFERALEVAQAIGEAAQGSEMCTEARWRMACALKALGKLYMTEHELREVLKRRHDLAPKTKMRSLLQLGYLYRELGDLYLGSVLMHECLELARQQDDPLTEAGVLNSLGNIQHDESRIDEATRSYRDALGILERNPGNEEMLAMVMTNLGGCLVAGGRLDEGVSLLQAAEARAKHGGFRRVAALALNRQGEAWKLQGDHRQAREKLEESDALATRAEGCYHDILFINAFYRWQMVRDEKNGTGEKIAFGRLRHIRSLLQRRFPEVDEFDRYVEGTRR